MAACSPPRWSRQAVWIPGLTRSGTRCPKSRLPFGVRCSDPLKVFTGCMTPRFLYQIVPQKKTPDKEKPLMGVIGERKLSALRCFSPMTYALAKINLMPPNFLVESATQQGRLRVAPCTPHCFPPSHLFAKPSRSLLPHRINLIFTGSSASPILTSAVSTGAERRIPRARHARSAKDNPSGRTSGHSRAVSAA